VGPLVVQGVTEGEPKVVSLAVGEGTTLKEGKTGPSEALKEQLKKWKTKVH